MQIAHARLSPQLVPVLLQPLDMDVPCLYRPEPSGSSLVLQIFAGVDCAYEYTRPREFLDPAPIRRPEPVNLPADECLDVAGLCSGEAVQLAQLDDPRLHLHTRVLALNVAQVIRIPIAGKRAHGRALELSLPALENHAGVYLTSRLIGSRHGRYEHAAADRGQVLAALYFIRHTSKVVLKPTVQPLLPIPVESVEIRYYWVIFVITRDRFNALRDRAWLRHKYPFLFCQPIDQENVILLAPMPARGIPWAAVYHRALGERVIRQLTGPSIVCFQAGNDVRVNRPHLILGRFQVIRGAGSGLTHEGLRSRYHKKSLDGKSGAGYDLSYRGGLWRKHPGDVVDGSIPTPSRFKD